MSIQDHIAAFAEGWTNGDLERILQSLAPEFRLDDPNAGEITRDGIPAYLAGLKEVVAGLRGEAGNGPNSPLMEMSEVVIKDDAMPVSLWAWWNVPGTPIAGSALVKVGEEGVISERLAYHTALAG